MRTIRLFSAIDLTPGSEVVLDERAGHRAGRVLRRRVGDRLVVFNGDGRDADAEIVELKGAICRVRIDSVRLVETESPLEVHLIQAVAKGDKMDWVVQKAVELGVTGIHPVLTEHTDVRLDAARAEKRRARWQEIALGACEQCGRARVPEVSLPVALEGLVLEIANRLWLDPEGAESLADAATSSACALAVGPEGGFGARDRQVLADAGYRPVSFGPRILRTETAGAAALAVLQATSGDLGR